MKPVRIDDLSYGLMTKLSASQIPLGACQSGSKNFMVFPKKVRKAKGFKRLVNARPSTFGYKLSNQYFRGNVSDAGTVVSRASLTQTFEIIFRPDRLNEMQVLVYKGRGEAVGGLNTVGNVDWTVYINRDGKIATASTDSGGLGIDGGGIDADGDGLPVIPGNSYALAIVNDNAAAAGSKLRIYLQRIGSANQAEDLDTIQTFSSSARDIYFGAMPLDVGATPSSVAKDRDSQVQYQFQGVIQEVRFWSTARTATEIKDNHNVEIASNASGLIGLYRLTGAGTNSYFINPTTGTVGSGSGQMPRLEIEPRDMTRVSSGHVIANPVTGYTYSASFNGRMNGVVVRDSYLYRKQETDSDHELASPSNIYINTRLRVGSLKSRACVWHWTHVPDDDFGSIIARQATGSTTSGDAVAGAGEEFSMYLELVDSGGGAYEFMAVAAYETTVPSYRIARARSLTGGLVAGTEYDVTVTLNFTAGTLRIQVGSGSVSQNLTSAVGLRATPNTPEGSFRKYAFNIGSAVYRVRKLAGQDSDPNYFDVEYDYTKGFDGQIGHLVIGNMPFTSAFASSNNAHDILKSVTKVTRNLVGAVNGQVFSAWTFEEGAGGSVEDLGLSHNNITFRNDSGHSWSRSAITTAAKVRIRGFADHRYATATGLTRKPVVIAGGSIYEVNLTTGALTWLTDGFRNDEDNIVTSMRFQDSLVLCCGGSNGNYHLWKDQLWRLDILPPVGDIAWGIQDQKDDSAVLEPGTDYSVYQYAFTYENQAVGKVSPVALVLTVIVRVKCNVAFGTIAEINQTYASIETVQNGADGIEPYGVTAAAAGKYVLVRSYLSGDSNPQDKRVHLAFDSYKDHPYIVTTADATAKEYAATFNNYSDKSFTEVLPDTRLRINSKYIGSTARLRMNDGTTSFVTNEINAGGSGTEGPNSGTGVSSHGIALPKSFDPQVTHLTIWRTTANGQQFRRLVSLPNGTASFVDNIPDAELTGEILNIEAGPPPEAKRVVDLGGSAFYSGITNAPARIYVSEPGQPWNVRPQNVVDVFEGGAQEITGIARSDDALTLFKQDTSIVITPTGDRDFPLRFQTRSLETGCVSPFGVASIEDQFVFASEKGLYSYDLNTFRPLSDAIQPTWDAISESDYSNLVCVYDRENRNVLLFNSSGASSYNGSVINDQCLVFNVQVGAAPDGQIGGWSLLTGLYVEHAVVVPDASENNKVYVIEPTGFLSEWDSGENYAVGTNTSRAPATAAGTFDTTHVTVAQATLGNLPEGYLGLPITVVDATDGTRSTRMCTADTIASPSVLTLDHALDFTPVLADSVVVGSIEFDWITGEMALAGPEMVMPPLQFFHLQMNPLGTTGTVTAAWKPLYGVLGANYVELTDTFDANKSDVPKQVTAKGNSRGRRLYFRLKQLAPDIPCEFKTITLMFTDEAPNRGQMTEE